MTESKRMRTARERARRLIADALTEEAVAISLPELEGIQEPMVHFPGSKEPWISYPCRNISEVRQVLNAFPWDECETIKNGIIRHNGRATTVRDRTKGSEESAESYLVSANVEAGTGYGPMVEFTIHVSWQGRELRINARVESMAPYGKEGHGHNFPSLVLPKPVETKDWRGSIAMRKWEPAGGLGDLVPTRWSMSEDGPAKSYRITYYWAERERLEQDMARMLEVTP